MRLHHSGTNQTKPKQNGTRPNALTCQLCGLLLCLFAICCLQTFAVPLDLGIWCHPQFPYLRPHIEEFLIQGIFFGRLYVCGVTIIILIAIFVVVTMGPRLLRSGHDIQRNCLDVNVCLTQNGLCHPTRPRDFPVVGQVIPPHRHLPPPPLFFRSCGFVEVSVGRVRTPERHRGCICDTLLLPADLGTTLLLVVWPLL